jgi:hypothetical protein
LSCAIIIVIRTVAVIKNYSIPVLKEKVWLDDANVNF